MHKGIILLVKATTRKEAKHKAVAFLQPYGNGDVWDWYQIGGRWTGELTGYSPENDPDNQDKDGKAKWPTDWKEIDDNVMPLNHPIVLAKVQEWACDWKANALENIRKSEATFAGDEGMTGYLLERRGTIMQDKFSFESNVFDVDNECNVDGDLPVPHSDYWAVMMDLHN